MAIVYEPGRNRSWDIYTEGKKSNKEGNKKGKEQRKTKRKRKKGEESIIIRTEEEEGTWRWWLNDPNDTVRKIGGAWVASQRAHTRYTVLCLSGVCMCVYVLVAWLEYPPNDAVPPLCYQLIGTCVHCFDCCWYSSDSLGHRIGKKEEDVKESSFSFDVVVFNPRHHAASLSIELRQSNASRSSSRKKITRSDESKGR